MDFNINKHKNDLLFVPLGGAGEIGMNFNLYQYEGKWLIVDCGAGFAEEYMPGIDMIIPDISFILRHKKDIEGIVLTHSHEDHFGSVQYLWDLLECPIYATKFTSSFLKRRLKDNNVSMVNKIYEVKENSQFSVGSFKVDFVSLCHSAPEMQALVIRTKFGNIFHTGDWKFDDIPVLGEVNDEKLLSEYGEEGVLALVGDSTNIFREEFSGSEGKLKESMFKIIGYFSPEQQIKIIKPYLIDPFYGILCLFLLDMGLLVAKYSHSLSHVKRRVFLFGIYMPIICFALSLLVGKFVGLSKGDALLFSALCASSSYIAVPAAMKIALPNANHSLSITLSLAVTFTFNIIFGIPLYYWIIGLIF